VRTDSPGSWIDDLSLNAARIPIIKKIIRTLSLQESKNDLEKIFQLETATEVRDFIKGKMQHLLKDLDQKGLINSVNNHDKGVSLHHG
jgi:signal transduction protein with GAF and PtsI domain